MKVRYGDIYRQYNFDEPDYFELVQAERKDWEKDSLCQKLKLTPKIFYDGDPSIDPHDRTRQGERFKEAYSYCTTCPTRLQCAELAIVTRESDGIWGGLSEKQRRMIRRRWNNGRKFELRKLIAFYIEKTIRQPRPGRPSKEEALQNSTISWITSGIIRQP